MSNQRLTQVDALRGIAALLVVGFHFTTRFDQTFPGQLPSNFSVPWGHLGVNLFFSISGFVIFLTLDRARTGMDFVVSRFSRLYPTYWVAIALTFTITHTLGPATITVPVQTAWLNGLMFHGLLGIPSVDGAYWTLEVELLFYGWMLLLFLCKQLRFVHHWLAAALALRWAYTLTAEHLGIELSWRVQQLLILQHLPWFVLGIAVATARAATDQAQRQRALWSGAWALLTLVGIEGLGYAALGLGLSGLVWWAAEGRLPGLGFSTWAWLGAVSYPLYLLHEHVGWYMMLKVMENGGSRGLGMLTALVTALALAEAVRRGVEQPAMQAIRRAWSRRRRGSA
ncbi:MAG: acyltransferase family protein [Rubrivivax sp.]|jgi:peptidoglycan/LPS O-acetylase OafA/YrhL